MSESTLNRLGRKPAFTRFEAYQMLENRKLFGTDRRSVDQFIEEMLAAGELKQRVSRATMHRLLTGVMFPDLHNFLPDGTENKEPDQLYDYKKVPSCPAGHPPKADRATLEGEIPPKLTAGQRKLIDEIKRQTEAHVATQIGISQQRFFEGLTKRVAQLEENEARRAGFEQKLR